MPKWVEKILKQNPGEKSLKEPFTIYLDLECLLKKEQSREIYNNNKNNSNNNSNSNNNIIISKKAKHEPSVWAMFITCSFDENENKLDYYRGEDNQKSRNKQKISAIKNTKYVIYAKISFVWIKMMKIIKKEKRLKIIFITQENLDELLIANAT